MAELYNRLVRKSIEEGIPLAGQFEISPICNFHCGMCYVRQSKSQTAGAGGLQPPEFWIDLAGQAAKEGMLSILLTGGEPFLYPDFRRLYETLYDMGFKMSVNSNGSLITKEDAAWLAARPPEKVSITLYGASNATYERFCGDPNGFDKVCRGVQALADHKIRIRFNCTLGTVNAEDLPDMIAFARGYRRSVRLTPYMTPPVRRTGIPGDFGERFTARDAGYYTVYNEYLQNKPEDFLRLAAKGMLFTELTPAALAAAEAGPPGHMQCMSGRCSCWVDWQGNLSGCGMVMQPAISLKQMSFVEAWERLKAWTKAYETAPACANCANRANCPSCLAMLLGENGSAMERPAFLCEVRQYAAAYYREFADRLTQDGVQAEEAAPDAGYTCLLDEDLF